MGRPDDGIAMLKQDALGGVGALEAAELEDAFKTQ